MGVGDECRGTYVSQSTLQSCLSLPCWCLAWLRSSGLVVSALPAQKSCQPNCCQAVHWSTFFLNDDFETMRAGVGSSLTPGSCADLALGTDVSAMSDVRTLCLGRGATSGCRSTCLPWKVCGWYLSLVILPCALLCL